ncbi:MAG: hypothetical protein WA532_11595 [Candidatus Korobacteraceae bacterium]
MSYEPRGGEDAAEKQYPRLLPGVRVWRIELRTAHLMAISVLFGWHDFSALAAALAPWLYATVASGMGMTALMLATLTLLCWIPFAWKQRLLILP